MPYYVRCKINLLQTSSTKVDTKSVYMFNSASINVQNLTELVYFNEFDDEEKIICMSVM